MPMSKEKYYALGRVTAAFAQLEYFLASAIWSFFAWEHYFEGQVLTAGARSVVLREKLRALAAHRHKEEQVEELNEVLNRIQKITELRNRYTHSAWILSGEGREAQVLSTKISSSKKGLTWDRQPVSVENLNDLADEAADLAVEVHRVVGDLHSLNEEENGD